MHNEQLANKLQTLLGTYDVSEILITLGNLVSQSEEKYAPCIDEADIPEATVHLP